MKTLLGATCAGSLPSASLQMGFSPSCSSARLRASAPPAFTVGSLTASSFSRLPVPTTATSSESSSTSRHPSAIIPSISFRPQPSKNGTTMSVATGGSREARTDDTHPLRKNAAAAEGAVVASEEASTSYNDPSRVGTVAIDVKAWRAGRAARRTTRRRALALCLALAGLTQHGPLSSAGLDQEQSTPADSQARDLIRLSQSSGSEMPGPAMSAANGESYGDLVTVSTGSSDSLNGNVRGLPSWMKGNYHLCLGDGFHVQLPSDWHMHDTQGRVFGTVLRYEDKADPTTNVVVLRSPTSKYRINNNPEAWIREQACLLSGTNEHAQPQLGEEGTDADRYFRGGKISTAKVINVDKPKYKQGLTYYNYEILTKQGGEQTDGLHELVSAVVNNGNLYMCRVQTGEGRWQEDLRTMARSIVDSFQITGFKINV